ncbi:MAG: PepSY-like domain-containing protein [Xanthomarina gelatinilytica]|uniref:PepSY-like domain-containing protein n=1 Tax=Xanthomarina gelatinilytica TaxID=1137281 RepID=UPI003A8B9CD3
MKTLKLVLFALVATVMSCSNDDNAISNYNSKMLSDAQIPNAIKTYVTTHFPSNDIISTLKETVNNTVSYALTLTDNVNLKFNNAYAVTQIISSQPLPNTVIPQAILNYVAANYPNNTITDWNLDDDHQEVELDNNLELEFTLEGVFIGIDTDNDGEAVDEEIVLLPTEIPTAITDYINTHFPNNTVVLATKEIENFVITYDIDLNGNIELEFNSVFEITSIESLTALPSTIVPQAILDYLVQNYPNNFVTSWELEANHQQVELDNNLDLEFTLAGEFIRIDND